MTATGIAGRPASYFYETDVLDWCRRMGVAPFSGMGDGQGMQAVLQSAQRMGCNGTALFGLRQQRQSFAFLLERLSELFPEERSERMLLERAFGATAFIYLHRSDKVGQAVSYIKAQQSGLWHLAADGTELERLAPHAEPIYDADAIAAAIETFSTYDSGWEQWFRREGIAPLRLGYDELVRDPGGALARVLEHLGLDPRAADGVSPDVWKLADATSRDWVKRFRARQGADSGPQSERGTGLR